MDEYHFFYHTASPFSQWHPTNFLGDTYFFLEQEVKVYFSSAEQYMMYRKAVLFQDIKVADKILETSDPKEIKDWGRKVCNFDEDIWDGVKFDVVVLGNLYKFSQNADLGRKLLDTGTKILVEASPSDKVWGIGLSEAKARKTPEHKWPGQNLLGSALMRVRHIIRSSVNNLGNPT